MSVYREKKKRKIDHTITLYYHHHDAFAMEQLGRAWQSRPSLSVELENKVCV
jgi:hypothetical protein